MKLGNKIIHMAHFEWLEKNRCSKIFYRLLHKTISNGQNAIRWAPLLKEKIFRTLIFKSNKCHTFLNIHTATENSYY
jgi:hypothetical protein